MATTTISPIGQQLVDFALNGSFPDTDISSSRLNPSELSPAIQALAAAKAELEHEIQTINAETADDVSSWVAGAKAVQADIIRSKQLANEIVRRAEEPEASGESIHDAEERVAFLRRELSYSQQLKEALEGLQNASSVLDEVEQAAREGRILEALGLLEKSNGLLDSVADNVGRGSASGSSIRAVKLLEIRAFELKNDVSNKLGYVWDELVQLDKEQKTLTIDQSNRIDGMMNLEDAITGLRAFHGVDERMAKLWEDLDELIVASRMEISSSTTPGIVVRDGSLRLEGHAGTTTQDLFTDLDTILTYLAERLPQELVDSISALMIPVMVSRISSVWLDQDIPTSVNDMGDFEQITASCRNFCARLKTLQYSGFDELQAWVDNVPKVWLTKCRETALDSVRSRLTGGLGSPRQVERVETQAVSMAEGKQLVATTTAVADEDDWSAAWGDQQEEEAPAAHKSALPSEAAAAEQNDDGTDAWGWADEEGADAEGTQSTQDEVSGQIQDDDAGDAWGWGEEDGGEKEETKQPASKPITSAMSSGTREMTLKESYTISAMPDPVLQLIFAIIEDGASLTEAGDGNPVAAAAAGLFSLPTLALAMFRAVSPYYYSLDVGGNMYLYNDTAYLAEKLSDFATAWKARDELTPRARTMVRLDNDIKALRTSSTRAYTREMLIQRTALRDLLGGAQSLMQRDELESCVDAAVARIRSMALTWESILAKSAWHQAVGALLDCVAGKIIADVMDAPGISQDDAYNIAKLIATVAELDDLFVPPRAGGKGDQGSSAVPLTAQYATSWLRLKFLSEVLQSNLRDVRFLWRESELSLHFTLAEVVELVNLSFEDNARTREVLREITASPHPLGMR